MARAWLLRRMDTMRPNCSACMTLVVVLALSIVAVTNGAPRRAAPWRAVHVLDYNSDAELDALGHDVEQMAAMGVNVLILEVDYHYAFKSHPELRQGDDPITRAGARRFAAVCRRHGVRLIPQFQCLG